MSRCETTSIRVDSQPTLVSVSSQPDNVTVVTSTVGTTIQSTVPTIEIRDCREIAVTISSITVEVEKSTSEILVEVISTPWAIEVINSPVAVSIATLGVQGEKGDPGEITDLWLYFVTTWSQEPNLVAVLPGGEVYSYDLNSNVTYRFVPDPYNSTLDAFYDTFENSELLGFIVRRG